ncbi:hypothetical protein [Propionibacterium sp. oral taxon 192]|uniref:hypothetical protein n=1 Tax=Propionibacterium sp. oral taxon 192 TaxID=671222 RepID=UPI0003A488D5|nr:hypothetical protein [Propionibacterium sp. oral taxon 192]
MESKLPIGTPVRLRAGGDRIDDQNKMLTATLRTGKQTSVDELATAQERWIPDSITG